MMSTASWGAASCPDCRADDGWHAVGLIGEMTNDQLLAFQGELNLSMATPLTTTEEWSTALAASVR